MPQEGVRGRIRGREFEMNHQTQKAAGRVGAIFSQTPTRLSPRLLVPWGRGPSFFSEHNTGTSTRCLKRRTVTSGALPLLWIRFQNESPPRPACHDEQDWFASTAFSPERGCMLKVHVRPRCLLPLFLSDLFIHRRCSKSNVLRRPPRDLISGNFPVRRVWDQTRAQFWTQPLTIYRRVQYFNLSCFISISVLSALHGFSRGFSLFCLSLQKCVMICQINIFVL